MDFLFYAQWALGRVLNFSAYGHLLYFIALAIAFTVREWKQMAALAFIFVTTFYVAMALSVANIYIAPEWFINFLVPTSIVVAALCNFIYLSYDTDKLGFSLHGIVAFFSGFIHGFSFYHYFDVLIALKEDKISPILGLTVGVELSQILVILVIFAMARIFLDRLGLKRSIFMVVLSLLAISFAIPLLIAAYP